jgi:DNA-binding MarR family transcriptional regulator
MPEDDARAPRNLGVPQAPPEEQVGYLMVRIGHALGQRWARDLAPFGLTARQHGVLGVLAAHPGISAGALARKAMITPQSMGELLAGLQERGLVLRQPPAGRGHPARLELTDAARVLLAEVEPVVRTSNSSRALGLTDHEISQLRRLLTKVLPAVS